jgi:hypothetical protein
VVGLEDETAVAFEDATWRDLDSSPERHPRIDAPTPWL